MCGARRGQVGPARAGTGLAACGALGAGMQDRHGQRWLSTQALPAAVPAHLYRDSCCPAAQVPPAQPHAPGRRLRRAQPLTPAGLLAAVQAAHSWRRQSRCRLLCICNLELPDWQHEGRSQKPTCQQPRATRGAQPAPSVASTGLDWVKSTGAGALSTERRAGSSLRCDGGPAQAHEGQAGSGAPPGGLQLHRSCPEPQMRATLARRPPAHLQAGLPAWPDTMPLKGRRCSNGALAAGTRATQCRLAAAWPLPHPCTQTWHCLCQCSQGLHFVWEALAPALLCRGAMKHAYIQLDQGSAALWRSGGGAPGSSPAAALALRKLRLAAAPRARACDVTAAARRARWRLRCAQQRQCACHAAAAQSSAAGWWLTDQARCG